MQGNIFCDSNIFLYLILEPQNDTDRQKRDFLKAFLKNKESQINVFVSVQVLNEVCNVLYRKKVFDKEKILNSLNFIRNSTQVIPLTSAITFVAVELKERYGFSFYDSLIVAAAFAGNCNVLVTEDL